MNYTAARSRLIAGAAAIAAGIAQVSYFAGYNLGLLTPLREQLLIVGWNLALIPAALLLGQRLAAQQRALGVLATVAGLCSLLLWAGSSALRAITSPVEATYIFLSAIWWLSSGVLLWRQRRALGLFTVLLGLFAFIDATASVVESVSLLVALGGLKLPLALIWTFWIGIDLLMKPHNAHQPGYQLRHPSRGAK